ncbi:class III extradiol dioxygenase subunit B-like domain-containing protein [Nocardiopsis halotolerans]|uniref:class III extradiol dioxygenase subunit B-like domain-containing protein n=1 Tax=Nocardiopsis halotolerans TaxID=124252 RepID=UPI0003466D7F|nr:class III extradiol dioxygenase subunit B-like domain-containing protein [Nocardiopsis halotolerans]
MIVTTVVCPHPPLLLRELGGGQDPLAELRKECGAALEALTGSSPDVLVVIGGHDTSGEHTERIAPVREFGGTGERVPRERTLPPSLGVARRLLDDAGYRGRVEMATVAWDASAAEVGALGRRIAERTERVALLVLGDGSARRGSKAPGYLDERAFALDEEIRRCLSEGDRGGLTRLDPDLAAELMAQGRAALQVMAHALADVGDPVRPEVLYADDPFGVMYFVAVWPCASS